MTDQENKEIPEENSDLDVDFDEDDEFDAETAEKKSADREEKLKILLQALQVYCTTDSEYDGLRALGEELQNGGKLTGTVLSGGYTNYSYKIHLDKGDDNEDDEQELAVFAKIAFPYALWDPSQSAPYDLDRVTAEFDLMKRFSDELKITVNDDSEVSPIPKPYVLIDIPAAEDGSSPNMKIFVAEWVAPTDEQWGNQFIEGEVDERIVDHCAKTFASINLADVDDECNQGFVESFATIATGFDALILSVLDREHDDKVVAYAKDVLGKEKLTAITKEWHIQNRMKQCLIHADAHVFNILVERKPNPYSMESSYGPKGNFYLCDWEMAHKGHKGRDVANFFSFPVMSACFLAARGHKDKADAILDLIKRVWFTYKAALVEGLEVKAAASDDPVDIDGYVTEVCRSAIAFFGYFSFVAFYLLGCIVEFNETEGLSDNEEKHTMGVVAFIGLRSMEVGFLDAAADEAFGVDDGERLSKMESFFFGMIEKELEGLSEARKGSRRRSRRRSSMLRESLTRVSDSESGFGRMVRRLSQQPIVPE